MKTQGTIYICDECGKKYVCEDGDTLPPGWIGVNSFNQELDVWINGNLAEVNLWGMHFCSTPCLTFRIGKAVADAGRLVENEDPAPEDLGDETSFERNARIRRDEGEWAVNREVA